MQHLLVNCIYIEIILTHDRIQMEKEIGIIDLDKCKEEKIKFVSYKNEEIREFMSVLPSYEMLVNNLVGKKGYKV